MALLDFGKKSETAANSADVEAFLQNFSIEVTPRTASKVENFRHILPENTRVYIAHIEGTPIEDMVETAVRLQKDGFQVMPHIPARLIKDTATLKDWVGRYTGEADIKQALLLAGGPAKLTGDYEHSMQLLDSGLFDDFERLHVAGHPEGNKDIDPDGSGKNCMAALKYKQEYANSQKPEMAIVTQFAFEANPVIEWVDNLQQSGISLPIHIGIAGPAKLQTLIKFALACGVGPSLQVLQKRAKDVTKLLLPYEPTEVINALAAHKAANPDFGITHTHFFPLGGIKNAANWAAENGGKAAQPAEAV